MPGGGIEPPQAFWALRILSPLRLPISPSRLDVAVPVYSALSRTGTVDAPEVESDIKATHNRRSPQLCDPVNRATSV